ncbi:hypothetical protein E0H75_19530 [Kribbella capetownensis]|uniref:Serine/threonine protein kinase n=1 Tax=Kribbella capetownensis TaxID=1572659 RepID=A0A4R0JUB6_9ACTN|nr:hypothetical protein [Kribbella capetownensis]TCC48766.1 hypothetical protein E0H75_19530 [Kribbella capetownensis]
MGQRSPLVTLAAAAVGLVALLVVNSTQTTSTGPASSEAAVTSAPVTPPNTARPAASPPPTNPQPTATKQAAPTPTQQVAVVYAGRTANREASLAIAVKGGRAAAYVCDGRRVEAWLTGTRTGDALALRSRAGDRVVGTLGNGQVTGTVTVHGRTLRFTISKADPPAGLYRAKTSANTIGWIVLADGSQVGIDNDGTPAPAPPLDPSTGTSTVGGTAVTATSVTGDETF